MNTTSAAVIGVAVVEVRVVDEPAGPGDLVLADLAEVRRRAGHRRQGVVEGYRPVPIRAVCDPLARRRSHSTCCVIWPSRTIVIVSAHSPVGSPDAGGSEPDPARGSSLIGSRPAARHKRPEAARRRRGTPAHSTWSVSLTPSSGWVGNGVRALQWTRTSVRPARPAVDYIRLSTSLRVLLSREMDVADVRARVAHGSHAVAGGILRPPRIRPFPVTMPAGAGRFILPGGHREDGRRRRQRAHDGRRR